MKNYKIMARRVEYYMMPYLSKIAFVVGCLVNLQKVELQELVDLYDHAVE